MGKTSVSWFDPTADAVLEEPEDTEPPADEPTSVYYLHTSDHKLLYVGITSRRMLRFVGHRDDKDWWPEVAYASFEHLPTRLHALQREAAAIRELNPRYNRTHRGQGPGPNGCMVERCHRKHHSRGLCQTHYRQRARKAAS